MIRRLVLLASCALLLMSVPAAAPATSEGFLDGPLRTLDEPFLVPDYVFRERLADGSTRDWGMLEFRGRVVLLNFWATWCTVCAKELPKLDRLTAFLRDQPIDVLAISIDEDLDEAADALTERRHRNLRVLHDAQSALSSRIGIEGVPTTFVVAPDGRAIAVVEGPADWNGEEARRWLRELAAPEERSPQLPGE